METSLKEILEPITLTFCYCEHNNTIYTCIYPLKKIYISISFFSYKITIFREKFDSNDNLIISDILKTISINESYTLSQFINYCLDIKQIFELSQK
jgi:hypothetical protein